MTEQREDKNHVPRSRQQSQLNTNSSCRQWTRYGALSYIMIRIKASKSLRHYTQGGKHCVFIQLCDKVKSNSSSRRQCESPQSHAESTRRRSVFNEHPTNIQAGEQTPELEEKSQPDTQSKFQYSTSQSPGGLSPTPRDVTCHLQRSGWVQRAERVSGAQTGPFYHVVVGPTEEPVLPQSELVPRDELPTARHATETFDVVDLGAGPHHEVVLAEADVAFSAFNPV